MEEAEKRYSTINVIAAISVSALIYLGNFVSPVISLISAEYPEISVTAIKMLTTIPSLMMVVMSLVGGSLTSRFPIKKIVLFASAFSLVGGLLPVVLNGFAVLIASRVIFGVGHGLIFPLASAIINQLFTGKQRDRLMGIRAGVGALIGACYSAIAGIVGMVIWRYSFACTAVVVPIALLIAWKCPENELSKRSEGESVKEKRLTPMTYVIYVGLFFFNMLMVTFMTNLSLVISRDGIGTVAQAGTVSSTFTVSAFVAGIIFAFVKGRLKRYTTSLAFGLVGLGLAILFFSQALPLFYVGAVFYGLGFGFYNPQLTMVAAQTATKPKYAPIAIAGYTSCVGIGQFMASIVLPQVARILGITSTRSDWLIAFIGCGIAVLISGIYITATGGAGGRKKEA